MVASRFPPAPAAESDQWVRSNVQTSRDSPRPAIADGEWRRIRDAKLAQLKAAKVD